MLRVESVVIIKAVLGILKPGDVQNKDVDVTECRKSYLGFGMKKKGRNIVRQKKMLRLVYMAIWL